MRTSRHSSFDSFLKYALYPLLLLGTILYLTVELRQPAETIGRHYPIYLLVTVASMIAIEALHPLRQEWKMTRGTFFKRDLPYLLLTAATLGAANFVATSAVLHFGLAHGAVAAAWPLIPSVLVALIIPEFLWYWVHRLSHENRGAIGRWLWRMHLPHHMPEQLYVMMHVVGHPLNTLIVRVILTTPLFFLGFSTESLFVASVIVGLQGVVSHFNVDMRTGWFNYILVGNELHRYHHSADIDEAKNFGNTVPLWDLVFGTFLYRPGIAPLALGLSNPQNYPHDREILKTLRLVFAE